MNACNKWFIIHIVYIRNAVETCKKELDGVFLLRPPLHNQNTPIEGRRRTETALNVLYIEIGLQCARRPFLSNTRQIDFCAFSHNPYINFILKYTKNILFIYAVYTKDIFIYILYFVILLYC